MDELILNTGGFVLLVIARGCHKIKQSLKNASPQK